MIDKTTLPHLKRPRLCFSWRNHRWASPVIWYIYIIVLQSFDVTKLTTRKV